MTSPQPVSIRATNVYSARTFPVWPTKRRVLHRAVCHLATRIDNNDRFLCSLPLNKLFSTISDPAFTEANKALKHFQKASEKRATVPARNGKKPNSNEQMKKLFDSARIGRGQKSLTTTDDSRPSFTSVSFSTDEDDIINFN